MRCKTPKRVSRLCLVVILWGDVAFKCIPGCLSPQPPWGDLMMKYLWRYFGFFTKKVVYFWINRSLRCISKAKAWVSLHVLSRGWQRDRARAVWDGNKLEASKRSLPLWNNLLRVITRLEWILSYVSMRFILSRAHIKSIKYRLLECKWKRQESQWLNISIVAL